MTKRTSLSAALATAAGKPESVAAPAARPVKASADKPATVLIAAHFSPEVRRVLKLIEADSGKNLKQLLGRAINHLASEYGKPEPYRDEA